jgi:2-dehydro-3-deoxygluconokinase
LLADAGVLHLTGITPALSAHAAANNLLAAQHARRLGVTVSVDVNFRAQLWAAAATASPSATAPESREALLLPLLREAHIIFASAADLATSFGQSLQSATGSPTEEYERVSAKSLERLPNAEIICTCLRVGEFADQARLVAIGRTRRDTYRCAEREIPSMVDRIGSGDAFAAGVLHDWLRSRALGPALEFGLAAAALKHSVPGDVNRVTEAEVAACRDRTSAAFIRR